MASTTSALSIGTTFGGPHQSTVIMDPGPGSGPGPHRPATVIMDPANQLPICPLPEPALILLDPSQYYALLVAAQGLAVLNMSTLQLPPLLGLGSEAAMAADLRAAAADAAAAAAAAAAAEDINRPPAHHELTTLTGRMPVYEPRPSARTASMSSKNDTQSLGAESPYLTASSSSSSSSSSPRYSSTSTQGGAGSDGENRAPMPQSRFYGKLAPSVRGHSAASISLFDDDDDEGDAHGFFRSPESVSLHSHSGGLNSAVAPRRRGRQSKDEQLAAANGLPISAAEIADMSLPDLQKLLKADSLTEPQRQLIRKIRRRGKNKVAARTCRQRRGVARTDHVSPYENARVLGYSNRH